MKRREFLSKLGITVVSVSVGPLLIGNAIAEAPAISSVSTASPIASMPSISPFITRMVPGQFPLDTLIAAIKKVRSEEVEA